MDHPNITYANSTENQHAPVEPPAQNSTTSHSGPYQPYSTPRHRVTKGRYITGNHPRGYLAVYEYPLNGVWIMMDVDDGYVLWTGIWKALGNSKADIVKMIESQPELAPQLRRVRGGYLKIQGTWMPYEVALRLARRVAWPIREDLVPLFGPTFPSTCLSPDQPGYGTVLENSGRRRKRNNNVDAKAKAAASTQAAGNEHQANYSISKDPPPALSPPQLPGAGRPTDLADHSWNGHPGYGTYAFPPDGLAVSDPRDYRFGPSSQPFDQPSQYPSESYSHHPRTQASSGSSVVRDRSSSRHRYSPYQGAAQGRELIDGSPHSVPPVPPLPQDVQQTNNALQLQRSPSSSGNRRDTGGYNLPPISTMGFESNRNTTAAYSLPPISSLRDGTQPSMDASSVLQRLRVNEGPFPEGSRPSDQYLQTRRSSSEPALPLDPLLPQASQSGRGGSDFAGGDASGLSMNIPWNGPGQSFGQSYDSRVPLQIPTRFEDPNGRRYTEYQQQNYWTSVPSPTTSMRSEQSPLTPSSPWSFDQPQVQQLMSRNLPMSQSYFAADSGVSPASRTSGWSPTTNQRAQPRITTTADWQGERRSDGSISDVLGSHDQMTGSAVSPNGIAHEALDAGRDSKEFRAPVRPW